MIKIVSECEKIQALIGMHYENSASEYEKKIISDIVLDHVVRFKCEFCSNNLATAFFVRVLENESWFKRRC